MTNRVIQMGDSSGPFFYRKVQEGQNGKGQDNPYTMSLTSWRHTPWHVTRVVDPTLCGTSSYSTVVETFNALGGNIQKSYPSLETADAQLLDKLTRKVNEHNWQAGVTLGEARESVQMVAKTAKTLADAFVALKKRDVRGVSDALGISNTQVRRQLHAAASGYLYLQFGVLPLLSDAYEAGQAVWVVSHGIQKARYRTVIKRKGDVTAVVGQDRVPIGYTQLGRSVILHMEEGAHDWMESLGLTDPGTLYDLVPLSFVADWFFPLGDYLHRRHAVGRFWSQRTVITTFQKDHYTVSAPSSPPCWTASAGRSEETNLQVQRVVGAGVGSLLHTPTLRTPKSWGQAATACALLWQRFGSRKGALPERPNYFARSRPAVPKTRKV